MTDQKRNQLNNAGTVFPSVVLEEMIIDEAQFVDYLGVRLDGGLRWSEHIDKHAKQLASNIFVLKNISSLNNILLSKLVYFGLIESLIRYSIILWGSSCKGNLNRIFVLQKRAIRCILKLKPTDLCYVNFKQLQILTVPGIYML
uniref:Alkylated DNA repair protein AlkB homologue 8 N-terminal domain-containing protein n=1 Tax=Cuerna arida TaxID=1464854 RepID=A0A1B6GLN6_9HEMI